MSSYFQRVKAKMVKEISSIDCHTPESWADIMLRNSSYLKTVADQESFFNWILNPSDSLEFQPPVYKTIDPNEDIVIEKLQTMTIKDADDEKACDMSISMDVEEYRNGLTSYILVKPRLN